MSTNVLSLIIPVFNGEAFIASSLTRIHEWQQSVQRPIEVIIVNDGSSDTTHSILENFREKYSLRLVSLVKNCGKGKAIRAGIQASTGAYIAFTDADLPYGFLVLETMISILDTNPDTQLVYGSRSLSASKNNKGYGLLRKIGRTFFSLVAQLVIDSHSSDTQCGVKMFRRRLGEHIVAVGTINRFAFDIELFAIARQNNWECCAVPVELTHRKESSVRVLLDTVRMIRDSIYIKILMLKKYYVRH